MCVGDYMLKKIEKAVKSKMKYIYIITFISIFIDQITKFMIRFEFNFISCINCLIDVLSTGGVYKGFNVIPGKGIEIIPNFFYIIEVKNTGGAWGIFSGNVPFLALISFFVVILLYLFIINEKKLTKLSIVYYGFLLGGIIGNLIDRLINGYVTDFFNFFIFGYDYPVFNIADILIVVGIGLMIIDVVRGEINAFNERKRKYKD